MAFILVLADSVTAVEDAAGEAPPSEFGLLLDVACAIGAHGGHGVRVVSVIEAGAEESLSSGALAVQERRMGLAAWNRAWADLKRERLATTGTFKTGDPDPLPDIQPVVSVARAGAYWQELANTVTQQGGSLLLAAGKAANARLDGVTLLQH